MTFPFGSLQTISRGAQPASLISSRTFKLFSGNCALDVNDMPAPYLVTSSDCSKISHSIPRCFNKQPNVSPAIPAPIMPTVIQFL